MTKKELSKINKLYNNAIDILETDTDSSLFLSRKTAELIIHKYFEKNNIKKIIQNDQDYPIFSEMAKRLKRENRITDEVFECFIFCKDKGNDAVHFTGKATNTAIATGSIKRLSKLIVWFLEEQNSQENTLYIYAVQQAGYRKSRFKDNSKVVDIDNKVYALCNFPIFKSSNSFRDISGSLKKQKVFDKDIITLFDKTEDIVETYEDFLDESREDDDVKSYLLQMLRLKTRQSPTKAFKELYKSDLENIKSLRRDLSEKYFTEVSPIKKKNASTTTKSKHSNIISLTRDINADETKTKSKPIRKKGQRSKFK